MGRIVRSILGRRARPLWVAIGIPWFLATGIGIAATTDVEYAFPLCVAMSFMLMNRCLPYSSPVTGRSRLEPWAIALFPRYFKHHAKELGVDWRIPAAIAWLPSAALILGYAALWIYPAWKAIS